MDVIITLKKINYHRVTKENQTFCFRHVEFAKPQDHPIEFSLKISTIHL